MALEDEAPQDSILIVTLHSLRNGIWQCAHSMLSLAQQLASRPLDWLPFASTTSNRTAQLQLSQEYISLQVTLLSGTEVHLRIECHQQLNSIADLVSLQTGICPDRQILVVSETKRRYRGLSAAARDVTHSWTSRKSTRSLVLGMVNYVLLPEVVSRELSGRGLYGWARGGLQGSLQNASRKGRGLVTVQVETLAGLAIVLELAADSSLQAMQLLVQQETGIPLDRQRVTIEERLPPSKLLQLTNQVLLGSFAGLRAAGQAASWAHAKLTHQLYGGKTFPLQVRTSSGHFTTVVATMDMTLGQVHEMLHSSQASAPTQPASRPCIQDITFPANQDNAANRQSSFVKSQHKIVL